jgi:integrase
MQERTITILQQKTRNYANPIYIKIKMGDELYTAVKECLSSGIPCPYLIHYRPIRMTTKVRQSKSHPFAVTLDHLTKSFSDVRDTCGAYNHLPPKLRPTLHDLRALGSYLYKKAGYPIEYIQALDGHADVATTERYIDGHEAKKPVIVHADLSFKDLKSS